MTAEKKFDSEKEFRDLMEQFFKKMGYPETGVPIPNTEAYKAGWKRIGELFSELPLTSEQMIVIMEIVEKLNNEARQAGYKAGFETGQAYAWYIEDNPDYVQLDGKYVYIGDREVE